MKIKKLFFYILVFFTSLNSFAFRLGFNSSEKQMVLNFESWKTSPDLNVKDMTLKIKKIDPDPYAKKFQKVFMFVHKNDLTLSYFQVFLQCRVNPDTAEKTPVLLMSQFGVMNFETIENQFKYTLGMSNEIVMNIWAMLKQYALIKSQANPCSKEFEQDYKAYLSESLIEKPIREENFVISADDNYFYLQLDNFFNLQKKLKVPMEQSIHSSQQVEMTESF